MTELSKVNGFARTHCRNGPDNGYLYQRFRTLELVPVGSRKEPEGEGMVVLTRSGKKNCAFV